MMIEQKYFPLVQFVGDEAKFIMQAPPQWHEVPAKMCAKDDATIHAARRAMIRAPPDLVHQFRIGPRQIFPRQPPAHRAIAGLLIFCGCTVRFRSLGGGSSPPKR